ncbi:MAG: tyrosine-type recombinase/integrase [Betaproteobacteria bacterium]|nr:tyrosine-type recombinase/integrase [Betaproteobacteria bacterium]
MNADAAKLWPAVSSSSSLGELEAQSAEYAALSLGAGTRRAYVSAWRHYTAWCATHGLDPFGGAAGPLPLYVTHMAKLGRAVSTIRVALAGIAKAYRLAGFPLDLKAPQLAPVVEGVTRGIGMEPRRQATPAVPELLRALLAHCGEDDGRHAALTARNRAMLLLGFGAAMRRSELVALTLGDVGLVPDRGVMLKVRRSKTDKRGEGQQVAIWANSGEPDFCPAVALEAWLAFREAAGDVREARGQDEPEAAMAKLPLFCAVTRVGRVTGHGLSDKAVVRLIKATAAAAGMKPKGFSGHSLRAGLITAAGEENVELPLVMRQARQKDPKTTLGYLRPADLWRNNATAPIFRKK